MSHLNGESLNIEDKNIEKLVALFPEVNTDEKIDFEKLKQILGEYVDDSEERYRFVWNGKGEALRLSQTPSMGTLRPAKEEGESKNWDETENLYIEGDNLEVLKLLQKSYFNKIKMIYIDPPYNTGGDFVYKDNFKDNIQNYKKITGQVDSEGNATTTNREYSGRYHTDWLNMMYPRLRLARNLLKDDGVIFISIDDHELHNLRKICDEIFGEENFVSSITREAIKGGSISKNIRITHDYILVYSKNINNVELTGVETEGITLDLEDDQGKYARGRELNKWGAGSRREDSPSMWFPIPGPNGEDVYPIRNDGSEGRWRLGRESMNKLVQSNDIIFEQRDDGTYIAYQKLRDDSPRIKQFTSLFVDKYINAKGTEIIKSIFKLERALFDYSKPINLIKDLITMANLEENDIVLDFFSGSSTTAHAVIDINGEDNGSRKFIMVQLPEPTEEKSIARKEGYKNITEIGKERIRRAGEKVKAELKEKYNVASEEERKEMKHPDELDIGFKVFKLDSSNIKEWNPGKYENVQQAIEDALTPYVPGRTEEDVVYEMMLKMGLDLTYPVEEIDVNGKTIYSIGYGFLMICLADKVDIVVAEKMIEIKDDNNQQEFRAIFRDEGFSSDTDKTNVKETLRSAGLAEESFITL